jgi:NAD(P)-dependent dehydrogenase (short-subunit alcohol dehydrogenase family)
MKLQDKVALVTGASSGIGRAIAQRFASEGAKILCAGRREDRLREVADGIRQGGGSAAIAMGDVTKDADCRSLVDAAVQVFGRISILVNAAGVIGADGIVESKPAEWRRLMDSNLESVYSMTAIAAPHLIKERGNSVINLSSVTSIRPYSNLLGYCVSKAAVDMLTQVAALEFAPYGVRVNAINPGVVVTELHTVTKAVADYPAFLERSKTTHPLGRVGTPEEIAGLACFLASEEGSWITGAIHNIDGGRQLMSAR